MLVQELKDFFANDMCYHIRRTAKPLTNLYNKILKEKGYKLECTQYYLLIVLYEALPKQLGLTELSVKLLTDRTTITRAIAPLIERGFVLMKKGADKRIGYSAITEAGKKMVEDIIPIFRDIDFLIKSEVAWKDISYSVLSKFVDDLRKIGDEAAKIKCNGFLKEKGESDD